MEWGGAGWSGVRGVNRGMQFRRSLLFFGLIRRSNVIGVEWSEVEWAGVEWSGVEWSGVGWSGVEWGGMGWSGVEWRYMGGSKGAG